MNRIIKKFLIVFFIFTSCVGFSTIVVTPLVPNMIGDCAVDKLQGLYNADDSLSSAYNKCSVLPQSIAIITAGIGLVAFLYLLRAVRILDLSVIGILLVGLLFVALELLFYVFFQYKYFSESQMAVTSEEIARNYLFAFSSLVSLTVSLLLVPKLVSRKLFSSNV